MSVEPVQTAMTTDPTIPFWQPFLEGLRSFVARRVPAGEAEDVTQDILLRLHRAAGELRDASRAQAWVYGVARRAIADFYRSRGPAAAGDEELAAVADPTGEIHEGFGTFRGEHSVHEEVITWLRPIAEQLPEKYREAILLADFEGVKQREVATRLGLGLSGAKSRVQRARKMLAEELGRCCEIEMGADGRVEDFRRRDCDCPS